MRNQKPQSGELDFSAVTKADGANAWRWEIFRELEKERPRFALNRIDPVVSRFIEQKGLLSKTFLSLNSTAKVKLFDRPQHQPPAFREVPFKRAPRTRDEVEGESLILKLTSCGTHVVQVAWDQSKTRILRDFKEWLETNHGHRRDNPLPLFFEKLQIKEKCDPRTWLKDLAIYRISKAGYTSTQAAEHLAWIRSTRNTAFSRSHFSDARARTGSRLKVLASLLEAEAKHVRAKTAGALFHNPFTVPIHSFR